MNTSELSKAFQKKAKGKGIDITLLESKEITKILIETMSETVSRGERLELNGFGTFESKPRIFSNKITNGEKLVKFVLRFKTSNIIKSKLNGKKNS